MSAFSASSALVLRTCSATLAGFFSTVAPRGGVGGDSAQLGDDLVEQFPGVGVDRVNESDVELGAVAADQLHFGGKSGQRSQILEGAARDHGSRRRREAGERAKRTHRFRPGDTPCPGWRRWVPSSRRSRRLRADAACVPRLTALGGVRWTDLVRSPLQI